MNASLHDMTLQELWQLFPICLVPHQDCWAGWYSEEQSLLRQLLPAARISHIGSTAVPGIMAKPTIDILLEFTAMSELETAAATLEEHGYLRMSQSTSRISLNKGYTPAGYDERVFHLHLRMAGDNAEIRFRDCLLQNPDIAHEYETLKIGLAARYRHDRDAYTAGKSDFINRISNTSPSNNLPNER